MIDIQETQKIYYIKIRPRGEAPIRVRWREEWEQERGSRMVKKEKSIDRYFRGDFRVEITERRSSKRSEWSLINVLPIEWYMRSVVGSEVPGSYTINAHLVQTVASRSYLLNKTLEDRAFRQEVGY